MRPFLLFCLIAVLAPAAAAQRPSALRPAFTERHDGALEATDDTLTSGEYRDAYTLVVEQGQEITVELVSDAFDPYLMLQPPEGEQFDNDDWNGSRRVSRIVYANAAAGTWRILATSYLPRARGSYALTFSAAFPSDSLAPAPTPASLAGTTWAEDCPGADPARTFVRLDAGGALAWSATSPAAVAVDGGDTWAVEAGTLVVRWNDGYATSRYPLVAGGALSGRSSASCGTNARLLRMP